MNSITPNPSPSQYNKPIDWRKVDSRTHEGMHTINRRIVQVLGWEAYTLQCNGRIGWNFRYASGRTNDLCCPSEDHLWQIYTPDYTGNLDTALNELIESAPYHFTLSFSPDRLNWRAETSYSDHAAFADHRLAAVAVCILWLKWNDPMFGGAK